MIRQIGLAGLLVLVMGAATHATHMNYFDFNVVSLGDIGTPATAFKGEIDGRAVAVGSAYLKGFSLNGLDSGPYTSFALYAGGDVSLTGSIHNGGIEAAGDISIRGGNVDGRLLAGGSLTGNGGSIADDVTLTGQNLAGHGLNIAGVLTEGLAYSASLDMQDISQYFMDHSAAIGGMSNTLIPVISGGEISIDAVSGQNVFTISADQLLSAANLTITAPGDAIVYMNVTGSAAALDGVNVVYQGGITPGRVLANMPEALSLDLSGQTTLNLLAPRAETYFASGTLEGHLVVGDLAGKGRVNQVASGSTLPIPVPEPSALMIVLCLAMLCIHVRRNGVHQSNVH